MKHQLQIADYVIVLGSLITSSLIGLGFSYAGGRQNTPEEYMLAGKNAQMFPAVMSTIVTMVSGIALMSNPAEVYRYGPTYALWGFFIMVGMILASRIFVPVYFQCEVSSIYEYLQMRYGKFTRCVVSIIFMQQTIIYTSFVLFIPVLALNAVTEFSTEMAIIVCGSVCTFYCFLGGLKAVLWSDVFQSGLMILCIVIVFTTGIYEVGGFGEIYRRSSAGNRLNFFDMSFDFTTRYTFWNMIFRGINFGIATYGCSQVGVQRLLCLSGCTRAQRTLIWSSVPVGGLVSLTCIFGIVLYSVFHTCDPILMQEETGVTKYDQIFTYFIITRLGSFPGVAGLCIAGIFSGSLSTMSSTLNSLATVTIVDFIQPIFKDKLNNNKLVYIAKALSLLYGIICILFSFAITSADSITRACQIFLSIGEGTVLAVFLIGVLTRKVSDKSAAAGILIGIAFVSWIAIGSMFSGFTYPALPLETSVCPHTFNHTSLRVFLNSSTHASTKSNQDIFILYKISHCWIGTLGSLFTVGAVFLISILIDKNENVIPHNSKCLSPVVKYWSTTSSHLKEVRAVKCNIDTETNLEPET